MLKIMLDNFKIIYDASINEGTIADNGFSTKFSINVDEGIDSCEILDEDIAKRLYSLIFPYIDWKVLDLFGKENWKRRMTGVNYMTICGPFGIRCYINTGSGTIEEGDIVNRFVIDYYDNVLTEFDMSLKSVNLIKDVFTDCKEDELRRGLSREEEDGPYGGAFRDWDDYYIWKNGSLNI